MVNGLTRSNACPIVLVRLIPKAYLPLPQFICPFIIVFRDTCLMWYTFTFVVDMLLYPCFANLRSMSVSGVGTSLKPPISSRAFFRSS